jgi:hypothetical protein
MGRSLSETALPPSLTEQSVTLKTGATRNDIRQPSQRWVHQLRNLTAAQHHGVTRLASIHGQPAPAVSASTATPPQQLAPPSPAPGGATPPQQRWPSHCARTRTSAGPHHVSVASNRCVVGTRSAADVNHKVHNIIVN